MIWLPSREEEEENWDTGSRENTFPSLRLKKKKADGECQSETNLSIRRKGRTEDVKGAPPFSGSYYPSRKKKKKRKKTLAQGKGKKLLRKGGEREVNFGKMTL